MLVKKKVSKSKTYIQLGVIFLILGITAYLLYTNLFAVPPTATPEIVNRQVILKSNLKALPKDFDKALFSEEGFNNLRTFGNVPVKIRSVGKNNLFGID